MNGRFRDLKKWISGALLLFFFFGALTLWAPLSGRAIEDPQYASGGEVAVCHNDSGTVMFRSEGAHAMMPGGAGTKLAAAMIFADAYEGRYQEKIAVDRRVTGKATSTMNPGLKSGESVSIYDLLCGMLVSDSEDAAYALAYDLFEGDPDAPEYALDRMNGLAADLELNDTRFASLFEKAPSSSEEDYSVSSLSDLMTLALEAQKRPVIKGICALESYTVPATDKTGERLLLTRNYLLSARRIPGYTYKNATGLSSFEGGALGSCGIFTAELEGRAYTCVVCAAPGQYAAFKTAKSLFEWAKDSYTYKKVLDKARIMGEVKVTMSGDSDYVTVAPARSVSAFLPVDVQDDEISYEIDRDIETVRAPVREGMVAGSVRIYYRGRMIGETDLVATGSLSLSNSGYYFSLFLDFVTSPVFLAICISVFSVMLIYVLINARVRWLRVHRVCEEAEEFGADGDDGREEEGAFYALTNGEEESAGASPPDEQPPEDAGKDAPESKKKKKLFARRPKKRADRRARGESGRSLETAAPSGAAPAGETEPRAQSAAPAALTARESAQADAPAGYSPRETVSDARREESFGEELPANASEETREVVTELEKRAGEEEAALAAERAAKEEAARAQEDARKEKKRREHTFFDVEQDGQTPVGLPEDENDPGEYVPEGWGKRKV